MSEFATRTTLHAYARSLDAMRSAQVADREARSPSRLMGGLSFGGWLPRWPSRSVGSGPSPVGVRVVGRVGARAAAVFASGPASCLHQPQDERGEDQLHGQFHLPA